MSYFTLYCLGFFLIFQNVSEGQQVRIVPAEDQLDLLVSDSRSLTESYDRILAKEGITRPRGRREAMIKILEVFEGRARGFRRFYQLGASVKTVQHQLISMRAGLNNVIHLKRLVTVDDQFDRQLSRTIDSMIGLETNYILETSILDGRRIATLRPRSLRPRSLSSRRRR